MNKGYIIRLECERLTTLTEAEGDVRALEKEVQKPSL